MHTHVPIVRRAPRGVRVFLAIILLALPLAACASHNTKSHDTSAGSKQAASSSATTKPAWNYLSANAVDVAALIPPPPDETSPEARAFESKLTANIKRLAGPVLVANAEADENDSLWQFASVMGTEFTPERCPTIDALFKRATADANRIKNAVKEEHHRRRPPSAMEADETYAGAHAQPSRSEDWSYPSGHAMRAALWASLLAAIAPEKEEALLKDAWFMCLSRIVRGVHFPTDITAGFILGEATARALLEDKAFQRDLQSAREEWASVQQHTSVR